jgi:hypothetical protein
MDAVISAIIALSLTSAPPAEGPEPSEPLIRHSDQQARVQALLEEYAAHDEACSDDVDSAPLVVPIVDRGTLFGYAFVTPKLCLAGGVNRFSVLNDMHFIVDQMVRASHRTPFTLNADMSLDRTATNAAMLTAARSVIGEARVESLVLRGDDIRVLR